MEGFSYWIFLLIVYLLSAMMKKKQQKAASRKMEEEEKNWEAPGFVKDFFPDLFENESDIEEEILSSADKSIDNEIELEITEPSTPIIKAAEPITTDVTHRDIGTLKRKSKKTVVLKKAFFTNYHEVKRAVIYKEILSKPMALRRSIR